MLDSIWRTVSSIPNKIEEFAKSVGAFFSNFWDSFKNGLSDLCSGIGEFFKDLGNNIGSWFSNLWNSVENIFGWLGNFFGELRNFFLSIFVPTSEQWASIQDDYSSMGETINSHIPFIGLFSDELKNAQQTVEKTDFLVITIPSFSFSSGGVGVNTSEQHIINIRDKYEPYRIYVRGALLMVVVGMAFVFIIKYVLNVGWGQSLQSISKKGSD